MARHDETDTVFAGLTDPLDVLDVALEGDGEDGPWREQALAEAALTNEQWAALEQAAPVAEGRI